MRTKAPPGAPSAREWREHQLTHLPFRSWCPHCVAARAVADAHLRERGQELLGQGGEFHFDYCFPRNKDSSEKATVIVGAERSSKGICAHVVPAKGSQAEWVQVQIAKDIRKFGFFGRVVLKSDGENPAHDLLREVAKRRGDAQTIVEKSKPYDSKSNGRAERAVRSIEEQARVLKLAFEANAKCDLSVSSPAFAWLIEHAADLLTKCSVGPDGMTPYERLRGKRYLGEMYEFGACVHIKIRGKPIGGVMEARWLPGVWLGKRWTTDEHIVALPGGTVARAREVRPMPDDQAFDSEIVKGIVGLPSDPSGSGEPVRAPRDVPRVPVPREAAPVREATVRRVIIKRAYLERFGYTDGCRKCRDIQRGEESLGTVGHSEECRKRIKKK